MKFRATIRAAGKTATGIPVPEEVVSSLGPGKRHPVLVTLGGHSYRSSIASMGGEFMISLSAENRSAAGVAAGDEIEVEIERDDEPREVVVPDDLLVALAADRQAQEFFDTLSYSNKLRHVLAIDGAKTDETRQRRIAKAIALFRDGRS